MTGRQRELVEGPRSRKFSGRMCPAGPHRCGRKNLKLLAVFVGAVPVKLVLGHDGVRQVQPLACA